MKVEAAHIFNNFPWLNLATLLFFAGSESGRRAEMIHCVVATVGSCII